MVRVSDEPSDKKEGARKKIVALKKKTSVGGIWPCKMNGCNKQFAREADLKRHQRTTKQHSMPGFQCPQCDATFTRTDALRRHQKSRHNGVVIEPMDQDKRDGEEGGSNPSRSQSPSHTPSSVKGKERILGSVQPVQTHQGPTTSSGPSSYYRQHTATTSSYVPPRPPVPQFAHYGLPTSATRLNSATNWGNPHPWPQGTPYQAVPVYVGPSPYYRHHGNGTKPSFYKGSPESVGASSDSTAEDSHLDASLSAQLSNSEIAAAMAAVLKEAAAASAKNMKSLRRDGSYDPRDELSDTSLSDGIPDTNSEGHIQHTPPSPPQTKCRLGKPLHPERPEPMEHILTEDGEPMLNPAELLTQESLASPPPS